MMIGKCCYDCVFCIQSNAPIECGLHYDCIHRTVHKQDIDQWAEPCPFFIDENGEAKQ